MSRVSLKQVKGGMTLEERVASLKNLVARLTPPVELPTQIDILTYNGSQQTPLWSEYDSMLIHVDCEPHVNVGEYQATFTPAYGCVWTDGTDDPKTVTWNIHNPQVYNPHVVGMVLANEGNKSGTWVRVNQDFETVDFDFEHCTWAGMHTVTNDNYGAFVEIPVTYVKTETLTSGPYIGKNCWWTADAPLDGFHVHPAFIGQDGKSHPLQIASWLASNKDDVPFSEDKGYYAADYWNNVSYNDVHAKGWMADGVRPYNIYDHHLLARLMLTEFGTPDVQAQTVNGTKWDGDSRIAYHNIHDMFGLKLYGMSSPYCLLDGLTTLNGTYQVLAPNGSLSMVETNIACPAANVYPTNCRVDKVNNIDFGDLFIANMANSTENNGSFTDCQELNTNKAFRSCWGGSASASMIFPAPSSQGAFYLTGTDSTSVYRNHLWRFSRCV